MLRLDEKEACFDQYWREQPGELVDRRSRERAGYVHELLKMPSGDILDAGCGHGTVMEFLAGKGLAISGIDVSPEAVRTVRQKGFKAEVVDLEDDSPRGKYDAVLCLEVLQQLYDPVKVLVKLRSLLRKEGRLIVSLPNEFHFVARLKILLGRTHLGDFTHSHIRLFSPARHKALFRAAGLQVKDVRMVPLAPPRRPMISRMSKPLARWWPSLFAISSIYSLVRDDD